MNIDLKLDNLNVKFDQDQLNQITQSIKESYATSFFNSLPDHKKMKEVRKSIGMTLAQAAEIIGSNQGNLSRFENGGPFSYQNYIKLVDCYRIALSK